MYNNRFPIVSVGTHIPQIRNLVSLLISHRDQIATVISDKLIRGVKTTVLALTVHTPTYVHIIHTHP